jgi:mono/diheme cytochrome c family protein
MVRSTVLAGACVSLLGVALPAAAQGPGSGDAAKGKQVYSTYCTTCHGDNGDGQGPAGKALNPPPRDFTKGDFKFGDKDEDLFKTISNGAAAQKAKDGTAGSPLMAPWGNVIPEADRWSLVKYIRTFKK